MWADRRVWLFWSVRLVVSESEWLWAGRNEFLTVREKGVGNSAEQRRAGVFRSAVSDLHPCLLSNEAALKGNRRTRRSDT